MLLLCFVFAALVVTLDQLFKHWITSELQSGGSIAVIPGVIELVYVENSGAAFSFFSDMRWMLVAMSSVCILIVVMVLLRYRGSFWGTLGLSAALGGAAGNLADRLFQGYVVDMFDVTLINFAIFNIADIFITLGGLLFCISYISSGLKGQADELMAVVEEELRREPRAVPMPYIRADHKKVQDSATDDGKIIPISSVLESGLRDSGDVQIDDAIRPGDVVQNTESAALTEPVDAQISSDLQDDGDIVLSADYDAYSETRILEEYDLARLLSEYDSDESDG